MKKIVSLFLAAMMVLSLAACSGNSGSAPAETTAAAETDPDTETRLAEETSAVVETSAAAGASAAAETQKDTAGAPEVPSAENTYLILVQDADDASPLSGVTVQFCSDTECMVNRTDENGSAAFEAEPGNYTAHVLKVPTGYEANKEELSLTAENRMASFSLRKEGAAAETQAAEESQDAEADPAGK